MKVFLGTDHAGFEMKERIKKHLASEGFDVQDMGAFSYDADDDYPDFIAQAAKEVAGNNDSLGIIFGGSGQGEAMAANKIKGVRCAVFYTKATPAQAVDVDGNKSQDPFEIIKLTRGHNNANMLSLGVRFLTEEDAIKAVETFLDTPFSDEQRHARRIDKIKKIENV